MTRKVADPKAVAEWLRDERFAELAELFAAPLRAAVSADTVRIAWTAELTKHGPVSAIGQPTPAGQRVRVPVTCERGGLTVIMSIDDAGLLTGLRLESAAGTSWTPPPYATPKQFTEHEFTLPEPGTMTMPRGRGPRPAVVLLSGGGPFDRDETSGPNKPLKDLAWGLASRGVAVARFDKLTPSRTMTDEYLPPAIAAVRLLRQQRTVDPARVFLLGHSMGGKVAPRIAAAEPSVAGLVRGQ